MAVNRHIIRKQSIEVSCHDEASARDVQEAISRIYQEQVLPELDQLFGKWADADALFRLDTLEVDAGKISLSRLESDLKHTLLEAITRTIEPSVRQLQQQLASNGTTQVREGRFEAFLFFLEFGYAPWWSEVPAGRKREKQIGDQLKHSLGKVQQLQALLTHNPESVRRLVFQFSDAFLSDLLMVAMPAARLDWQLFLKRITRWLTKASDVPIRQRELRNELYISIFESLTSAKEQLGQPEFSGKILLRVLRHHAGDARSAELLSRVVVRGEKRAQKERTRQAANELSIVKAALAELRKAGGKEGYEGSFNQQVQKSRDAAPKEKDEIPDIEPIDRKEPAREEADQQLRLAEPTADPMREGADEDLRESVVKREKPIAPPGTKHSETGRQEQEKGLDVKKMSDQTVERNEMSGESEAEESTKKTLQLKKTETDADHPEHSAADRQDIAEVERTRGGNQNGMPEDLSEQTFADQQSALSGEQQSRNKTGLEEKDAEYVPELQEADDTGNQSERKISKERANPLESPEAERAFSPDAAGEEIARDTSARDKRRSAIRRPEAWEKGEGIYLPHAGMILLHPFLPTLFNGLQWVDKQGFLDEDRQESAVCLLYYLATGSASANEHELALCKVLCDMPIATAFECKGKLTPEWKAEADQLLAAAVRHWTALKNTSIDGLREGFLQREGKLSRRKNGDLLLQVEQKTVDILLRQLPWGLSLVKLPWMSEILYVEWG